MTRLGIFKVIESKFSYKRISNIWWLLGQLKYTKLYKIEYEILSKFLAHFWKFWATFYSSLWSHCVHRTSLGYFWLNCAFFDDLSGNALGFTCPHKNLFYGLESSVAFNCSDKESYFEKMKILIFVFLFHFVTSKPQVYDEVKCDLLGKDYT